MQTPPNEKQTENKEVSISNTSDTTEAELDKVTGGTPVASTSIEGNLTAKLPSTTWDYLANKAK